MSLLHVFNAGHDEALVPAAHVCQPSRAARLMERGLSALPALWAAAGDGVLLPPDAPTPPDALRRLTPGVHFITAPTDGRRLPAAFWDAIDGIAPWGYDLRLRHVLAGLGAPDRLLPDATWISDVVRPLSSRRTAVALLPAIIGPKNSYEKWLGIAPFAAHQGKIYPPRLMRQVIDQVLAKYPKCRIFLFGKGQQETETFGEWCREISACVNVGEHLETMQQELILMSHLDAMVSMDSANMHLASLTGTPVVSVWGATHPYAGFLGWNQSEKNAVQIDLPCRPCSIYGNKPCQRGDLACMKNIPPEQIVNRIEHLFIQ